MIKIAPSILSADFGRLRDEIQKAEQGGADYIHVDVMDGHFVPNITAGPVLVEAARRSTTLPLDVHLMMDDPDAYLERFVEAGANIITVHQETCPHLHRTIQTIDTLGATPGVTINPATPVSTLEEILQYVGQVLIMTVNPGFGGQEFIETMPAKVRKLRQMIQEQGLSCDVEVDGGINPGTCHRIVSAGANVLVAGAGIFAAEVSVAEAIHRLRRCAEKAVREAA
jgi:ribulose-phosphate 3-epimerase